MTTWIPRACPPRWTALAAGAMGVVLSGLAIAASPVQPELVAASPDFASFGGERAKTDPSRNAVMGFPVPTQVKEVHVKGGQRVKKGDLMIRGDDADDAAFVDINQLQIEDDLAVQRAKVTADLAQAEFDRYEKAHRDGGASPQEVARARLARDQAVLDHSLAKMQHAQAILGVDRAQARLDRLRLVAPFDGVIDAVQVDVGQSVSENDKALRIVNIDVLWIDVATPVAIAMGRDLKLGDPAWVVLEIPGEPVVRVGKIVEIAPTADFTSQRQRIRVELPNPGHTTAGVPAFVRFSEPTGVWKDRMEPVKARVGAGPDVMEYFEYPRELHNGALEVSPETQDFLDRFAPKRGS